MIHLTRFHFDYGCESPIYMNDFQPNIVSDAGHGGLEKVAQLNVNKHLTAKVKQMILDGRIPPDTKEELEMLKEHQKKVI